MAEVARPLSDDLDIATLAAEALMDLTRWDYWQASGAEPKGRTAEIIALPERVLAEPGSSGRHPLLHSRGRSLGPARARGALRRPSRAAESRPPFWYYPVRQSLGAALLAAGEAERAETAFEESLKKAPNNA
jgi:hypothetical protein